MFFVCLTFFFIARFLYKIVNFFFFFFLVMVLYFHILKKISHIYTYFSSFAFIFYRFWRMTSSNRYFSLSSIFLSLFNFKNFCFIFFFFLNYIYSILYVCLCLFFFLFDFVVLIYKSVCPKKREGGGKESHWHNTFCSG